MKVIDGMKVYEVEDLVELLGMSRVSVQRYLREGRIKGIKLARKWHVTENHLKAFFSGETTGRKTR